MGELGQDDQAAAANIEMPHEQARDRQIGIEHELKGDSFSKLSQ